MCLCVGLRCHWLRPVQTRCCESREGQGIMFVTLCVSQVLLAFLLHPIQFGCFVLPF